MTPTTIISEWNALHEAEKYRILKASVLLASKKYGRWKLLRHYDIDEIINETWFRLIHKMTEKYISQLIKKGNKHITYNTIVYHAAMITLNNYHYHNNKRTLNECSMEMVHNDMNDVNVFNIFDLLHDVKNDIDGIVNANIIKEWLKNNYTGINYIIIDKILDGYSQNKIAVELELSRQNINQRVKKIRNRIVVEFMGA